MVNAESLVLMFPGQSSRYPEMLDKVVALRAENATLVERASEVLGRDLRAHFAASNAEAFRTNRDVQVGVFLTNHLYLVSLEAMGVESSMSLGLSLGEYNHLVHIGALAFEDALSLVDLRGQLYDAGPRGAMASVFPLSLEDAEALVARSVARSASTPDRLVVGLDNSPLQKVLSGDRAVVDTALAILEEDTFVEAVIIEPDIPMHAPTFRSVGDALRPLLARAAWRAPRRPYVPNVLGAVLDDATGADFTDLLSRHVWQRVQWRRSVEAVARLVHEPVFVEVGPRGVLYGLMGKSWRPGRRLRTDSPSPLSGHFAALAHEVQGGA